MKEETFSVEMTKEQMLDFKRLYEHVANDYPFLPASIRKLYLDIIDIFENYCFRHKIKLDVFNESPNSSITLCRKCSPKEYKELHGRSL